MQVCIIGLGARTPVGLRAFPSGIAVHAGISRIQEHPYMRDRAGEPFMVALDPSLTEDDRHERLTALATSALQEVLNLLPGSAKDKLPVYLGLPELGPWFKMQHADSICRRLSAAVAEECEIQVAAITEGNAAGVIGLEQAVKVIGSGKCECCIVGGVDSFIDPDILEFLDSSGELQSTSNRWGFPPGEGACMLAVSSLTFARRHGLRILAFLVSAVTTIETKRIHTESICLGEGLAEAFALAASRVGAQIGRQYCDINGERYREHEFSYAILRVPANTFKDALDYLAPADCWGHTGAATAPLLTLIPIVVGNRGLRMDSWPMVWCGSNNGRRGAIVLHLE